MARLIVNAVEPQENAIVDAVGSEAFSFKELIKLIAAKLDISVRIVHMPTFFAYLCNSIDGSFGRRCCSHEGRMQGPGEQPFGFSEAIRWRYLSQ